MALSLSSDEVGRFIVSVAILTTAYCIFYLPPLFHSSLFYEPHFVLGTYIYLITTSFSFCFVSYEKGLFFFLG